MGYPTKLGVIVIDPLMPVVSKSSDKKAVLQGAAITHLNGFSFRKLPWWGEHQ
jgi:hypothetical protein